MKTAVSDLLQISFCLQRWKKIINWLRF